MVVVAFHICMIVLLVISRHAVQPKQEQGSLSVFALAAAPSRSAIQIPDPVIPVEAIAMIWSPAEMGEIRHDGDRLVTKIDFSGRAEIALDTEASVRLIKGATIWQLAPKFTIASAGQSIECFVDFFANSAFETVGILKSFSLRSALKRNDACLESTISKRPVNAIRFPADSFHAERGVRFATTNIVSMPDKCTTLLPSRYGLQFVTLVTIT